ncbi:MAG TPA: LysM domain-containing protein [Candidatus Deferrimicrobiaceae bacterium]|nr:LysM domain-containing protein [Candidatus Deferrimicrobiaceae bacterium]
MTDRGLPIADGAPACPFVAFVDDRDERATSPDHRHRCYAEREPAPRALAHQEAYCLSSAFPVCPTFQDWARREAARARPAGPDAPPAEGPDLGPTAERNPPRDWAAPPPWLADEDGDARSESDDAGEVRAVPTRGGGLAGSFADRVASGDEPPPASAPPAVPHVPTSGSGGSREPVPAGSPTGEAAGAGGEWRRDDGAPGWEQPRRLEAYPTIRARRLTELSVSPILIAFVALLLAAVVLFALPGLLGFGAPGGPAASVTPSAAPESNLPSLEPTPVPEPTATLYVVQGGDTMSKIANMFGIPLQDLIDANAQNIPDPNRLQIGDQVIIPVAPPTEIPGEVPAAE